MAIRVCVAGATGWTGSLVTKAILSSTDFQLTAAVARSKAGQDIGIALGGKSTGLKIVGTFDEAMQIPTDVLIDYTKPDSVKARVLTALDNSIRVVIGTSGLTADDYLEIEKVTKSKSLGVIASGNFSITAALAKHFSLIAAKYLPSWEIFDYAHADKVDSPSGTTRELAEKLAEVRENKLEIPLEKTHGAREARGATIAGTQVHSVRLHGYVIAFETIFGLPNERLAIRHDAGSGADPYVAGTLLAVKKVMTTSGLIRGLDKLIFVD